MDLYSRRIVGWKLVSSMEGKLVKEDLNRGLEIRKINPDPLLMHTNQASQCTEVKCQELLKANKFSCSMFSRGGSGIVRQ